MKFLYSETTLRLLVTEVAIATATTDAAISDRPQPAVADTAIEDIGYRIWHKLILWKTRD